MQGQASGPFTAKLDTHGLPDAPSATLTAEGALLGSPIDLALSANRAADGALHATLTRASWKSLSGAGLGQPCLPARPCRRASFT